MAFARDVYTAGAAQTDYTITFPYQEEEDVKVFENGSLLVVTVDYTFFNATTIRLVVASTSGDTVVLQRATSQSSRDVDFTSGTLTEADLDNSAIQVFYMAQEAIDIANIKLGKATDEIWDAESIRIKNVATPTSGNDAVHKDYADALLVGTLGSPLTIANGGTGSATADTARTALGINTTTRGDLLRGSSTGVPERVALGASGEVVKSDGTDLVFGNPEAAITGDAKNLVAKNGSVAASTVDVDCDEIVVKTADGGDARVLSGVNLTADITASGANGLDTGSEATSTWYYIWVIWNKTTTASLLSISPTAPSMPSGYTYKALVGSVFNAADGDLQEFKQWGKDVWYTDFTTGAATVLTAGTSTSLASVDLSAFVPPEAILVKGRAALNTDNAAGLDNASVFFDNDADSRVLRIDAWTADTTVHKAGGAWECPQPVAQTIYYANNAAGSDLTVVVTGWKLP